jgi:hypothetical protein
MHLTINVDLAKSLYLDERGDRVLTNKRGLDYFFIGGIEIFNKDKAEIVNFVREFKVALHPEENPELWELKGAGNPEFVSKDKQKAEQERKWIEWAKALSNSSLKYKVYGSFIKLSDYKKVSPVATEKEIIKKAFIDVAYKFANYGCVNRYLGEGRTFNVEVYPGSFYFDNVNNLQEESIEEAFKEYPDYEAHLAEGICIDRKMKYMKNEDYNLDDEVMMQFVDMQIYALTRLLCPSRGKDLDAANILMNFEQYVYMLPKLKDQTLKLTTQELKDISEHFYKVVPVFHDLQHRFQRFGYKNGTLFSSLSLIAEQSHDEFGFEASICISSLACLRVPNSKIYNILNNYE